MSVTVRVEQAGGGGQYGSFPIAFDASALENQINGPQGRVAECARLMECAGDGVVEVGTKLSSPPVEGEIEQDGVTILNEGNRTAIPRPCIVGFGLNERDPLQVEAVVSHHAPHGVGVGGGNEKPFEPGDRGGEVEVERMCIGQAACPVGRFMRPDEQNGILWLPFSGKTFHGGSVADVAGGGDRIIIRLRFCQRTGLLYNEIKGNADPNSTGFPSTAPQEKKGV